MLCTLRIHNYNLEYVFEMECMRIEINSMPIKHMRLEQRLPQIYNSPISNPNCAIKYLCFFLFFVVKLACISRQILFSFFSVIQMAIVCHRNYNVFFFNFTNWSISDWLLKKKNKNLSRSKFQFTELNKWSAENSLYPRINTTIESVE